MAAGALALLGYGLAAGSGAALSWDGSWSLFRTLRDGVPFIAHGRWADWPVLWVVGQAARVWPGLTNQALAVIYGGLLACVPLGVLAVGGWALRGKLAGLRVWPTLGILLVPLPGQWCLMSEATLVVQLGWALLAVRAGGVGGPWLTAGLAAGMFFLHPSAAVGFVVAAAMGWRTPRWAFAFLVLAGARLAWSWAEATPYERAEVSVARVLFQWRAAVWGLPLAMLAGTFALGLARSRAVLAVAAVGTALAGAWWAAGPARWGGALDYRRFVLPAELALMALAGWHWRRVARAGPGSGPAGSGFALPWVAGVFCVVMAVQAWTWRGLLGRFEAALAEPPAGRFISREELPWLHGTALDHWTACPLSMLLRPGTGNVFVLRREDVLPGGDAVQVTPWDVLALPTPPPTPPLPSAR